MSLQKITTLLERQLTMSDENIELPEVDEAFADIDEPTPGEEINKAQEVPPRDLGEAHRIILDIYHPRDDEEQYVVHVLNNDGTEVYGTLFSDLEHIIENFGNFMAYHIEAEGV